MEAHSAQQPKEANIDPTRPTSELNGARKKVVDKVIRDQPWLNKIDQT